MIVAGAARCRFCGAEFDSRFRQTSFHRGQSYTGYAVTSMVLGIVGIFTFCAGILFGILAVIFGAVALNGMGRSRNNEGRGMAIAGLVLVGQRHFAVSRCCKSKPRNVIGHGLLC